MEVKHHISYLCGYFSLKKNCPKMNTIDSQWERVFCERERYDTYLRFYYPEFVEFCQQTENNVSDNNISKYRMQLEQEFTLSLFGRKQYQLKIKDVSLYIMPCNMLIYAIQLEQNGGSLDDVTAALSILRNMSNYSMESISTPFQDVLMQIDAIYDQCADTSLPIPGKKEGSYTHLVENGNKLKIFQIAELENAIPVKEHEELLFELGTLAPIGSYAVQSPQSASPEYFEEMMKNNKIAIFNNWKGLSILDTFTIVGYDVAPYLLENWQSNYFEMIYLHSIFLKFYLFRTNLFFRKNIRKISLLVEEFIGFERSYYFNKISYNFLPLEIRKALDAGLEIAEEKEQLYHLIEQEKDMREKRDDRKMNNLLFFLTCLTMFSAVWDSSCLFDQLYPYETVLGSTILGYRYVAYTFFLLILLVIFLNRIRKR